MNWVNLLTNKVEIGNLFPNGGLLLTNLTFLQLTYEPGNLARVTLLAQPMPADAPLRWVKNGANAVEMRFDLRVRFVQMKAVQELDEIPPVKVSLGPGDFLLSLMNVDDILVFGCQFNSASLAVKPVNFPADYLI